MHTRKLRFKPKENDSFYKTDQHGECLNTITKCRNKTVKLLITNDEMIKSNAPLYLEQFVKHQSIPSQTRRGINAFNQNRRVSSSDRF